MLLREKVAAFDMDGTMIDSMIYWRNAYQEFLDERGLRMPAALTHLSEEKVYARKACEAICETYGRTLGMSMDDIWEAFSQTIVRHYATDVQLRPGILEYLDAIRAEGVRVGVATATRENMAVVALERLHLAERMDFGYFGEEMTKAQPEYFLRMAREQGAQPSQCAMFEDALYSMKGAKAAGFRVYAIEDFFARPDKPEILRLCDRYFTDYRELMNGEDTSK